MSLFDELKKVSNDASESATNHSVKMYSGVHPTQINAYRLIEGLIRKTKEACDNFEEEKQKARLDQNRANREMELVDTASLRILIDSIHELAEETLEGSNINIQNSSMTWESD